MRCSFLKSSGSQCNANAMAGKPTCHIHSKPGVAAIIGSAGGRRRRLKRPRELKHLKAPNTAKQLKKLLSQTMIDVRHGHLDTATGNVTALLASQVLKTIEMADQEAQLRALESAAGARRKG
jgi:hypothetical protein